MTKQFKNPYYFILLLLCLSFYSYGQMDFSVSGAVNKFLKTLPEEQYKRTTYSFNDTLRHVWTNLPVGLVPRPGIQYGSLSDSSRMAFHRVLAAMLSSQGYLKATSIMRLDDILNVLYQSAFDQGKINQQTLKMTQDLQWSHGNYYISVYGTPKDHQPWSINLGGHHIALTYTTDGQHVSMSPYFIGTDPSEVKTDKYAGLRILNKEEDYGLMLINMLNQKQKSKTILKQDTPKDIITNPKSSQRIDSYYGISVKEFTKDQIMILKLLIEEYTHNFEHQKAHDLMAKIELTGLTKIYFAWVGSTINDQPHYYIINGPDFLIEYDNVGFQNDGNHIHAILREKGNDFGEDLLKKHYLEGGH